MYACARESRSGSSPSAAARGVDAGEQTLRGGLLVSRGPVELAAMIEPFDAMRFERLAQFGRRNHVVFDRVAGAQHHAGLESVHRTKHFELDLRRQRRRKTADV